MQRRELLGLAALSLGGCAAPTLQPPSPPDAPPPLPASASRISFASCAHQTLAQPIWDTIAADKPDLHIFGGDNIYYSPPQWSLEELQRAYALEAAEPHFARFRRAVPHVALWDDNDYGANDGGAEFKFKNESKAAFLEFFKAPANDARRTRGGIYDARVFGEAGRRVQVIILDTRWSRSSWTVTDQRGAPGKERYVPDADPAKTMLGAEQWSWLEAQLREQADVRLVVSGIQVIVEGHGWERWGNLPLERQRLYDLIAKTRASGVVLLSGDRHFGAIYRQTQGVPYPLVEVTASGLTHPWKEAKEAGPNRISELFTEVHYGMVEVDWPARTVNLSLRDIKGVAQRQHRIAFDDMKAST
ncbi:alkaline phosphatase family protein [Caenimonas koreensis DSM 17982]|uniref:Alkaline phosphatase family protein n=1 Tax=Caenimonas koreensis DSM 17982 TaxID=1121255 RepID=A0A844AP73_9BURK|nr:alkaline phosphatase D family protein [Caenimonas koreensis]MRD45850.1 alkaline phosphatase family protein [Caenimonas koreensis DSM 17982]